MSYLLTVLAFGSIIFIHEFGHYLAAVRVGVRVEKFYLGFDFWGLKLFKYTYKGTEYGIGVFPFGGYVKLAGQEDFGKARLKDRPDEFPSKSVWQRIQILSAGVIFNFLSAFVLSALALYFGYRLVAPEVGFVQSGSAAWETGLKAGDQVTKYNNFPIHSFKDLQTEVALSGLGESFPIQVLRNGKKMDFIITPNKGDHGMASLGIGPSSTLKVKSIESGSFAHLAGVQIGDVLKAVEDKEVTSWNFFIEEFMLAGGKDKDVSIKVMRGDAEVNLSFKAQRNEIGRLGFSPDQNHVIKSIQQGSEAQKMGLKKGWKILHVGGVELLKAEGEALKKITSPFKVEGLNKEGQAFSFVYTGSRKKLFSEMAYEELSMPLTVSTVVPGSEAEKMKLSMGDTIMALEVDGEEKMENSSWENFHNLISSNRGKAVLLTVQRGGEEIQLQGKIGESWLPSIGFSPEGKVLEGYTIGTIFSWPLHMLRDTYKTLKSLVMGKIPAENMSGPLGIMMITKKVASQSVAMLFYLMALISINLAFVNILPIPVLDGGHILFCLIEGIKGKPLSEAVMSKIQFVGLLMIFSMIIFVTYNDLHNKLIFSS